MNSLCAPALVEFFFILQPSSFILSIMESLEWSS